MKEYNFNNHILFKGFDLGANIERTRGRAKSIKIRVNQYIKIILL